MKPEFVEAATNGKVVKSQKFVTAKGTYEILLVRHNQKVYYFKLLNQKIVECRNLSKED